MSETSLAWSAGSRRGVGRWVFAVMVAGLMLAACGTAAAPKAAATPGASGTPADQLAAAAKEVDKAIEGLLDGDVAKAKKEFNEFHDDEWATFEDRVKAKSPDHYAKIEAAIDGVNDTLLKAATVDKDKAQAALRKLRQAIDAALPSLR